MEYRKLKDLKKLKNNPRTIRKEDLQRLITSIERYGVIEGRPFLLSNRTGELVIIGGNMRYEACKRLDIEEVPTHLIEGLTEEQEREIIIRDNVSNGEWDMELLESDWSGCPLQEWGLDVSFQDEDENKKDKEDKIPEEPEAIYVQEGDIFQLGEHILMCGDSMNEEHIQKLLANRDDSKKTHCISDPPYGIAYNPDKHGMIKNDDKILDYTEFGKKYSNGYFCMWTGYQVVDTWMQILRKTFDAINNVIIWHKGGGGMGDCARSLAQDFEVLLVVNRGNELHGYKGGATWYWNTVEKEEFLKHATKDQMREILSKIHGGQAVWKVGKDNTMEYLHPTQKPVEINEKVLENFTAQGDNVLDLFGGSGSNLITCEKMGRTCYMMELDPKFIQVIIKRYYEYNLGDQDKEITCLNRDVDIGLITGFN